MRPIILRGVDAGVKIHSHRAGTLDKATIDSLLAALRSRWSPGPAVVVSGIVGTTATATSAVALSAITTVAVPYRGSRSGSSMASER
jgi:hypothetical protein